MWSKSLRLSLFILIYQNLLLEDPTRGIEGDATREFFETLSTEFPKIFVPEDCDYEKTLELFSKELLVETKHFTKNYNQITKQLEDVLTNESQTFDIIKACLYCFCLEKLRSKKPALFNKDAINIYIKLSEDFLVSNNVRLIHAVLCKIQTKEEVVVAD
jgi:transcription termination factor NusB